MSTCQAQFSGMKSRIGWVECSIFTVFCGFAVIMGLACLFKSASIPGVVKFSVSEPPQRCAPNCYNKEACAKVLKISLAAFFLQKDFRTEFRHQLQLLSNASSLEQQQDQTTTSNPGRSTRNDFYSCNLTLADWDIKRSQLSHALNGTKGRSCNLRLRAESAICAALVRQFQCAVTRILLVYGDQRNCLTSADYEASNLITEFIIRESSRLDGMYESVLLEHKANWESIEARLQILSQDLVSLKQVYDCLETRSCSEGTKTVRKGFVVNMETIYDDPDDGEYFVSSQERK